MVHILLKLILFLLEKKYDNHLLHLHLLYLQLILLHPLLLNNLHRMYLEVKPTFRFSVH
jgi:hypothetical protein